MIGYDIGLKDMFLWANDPLPCIRGDRHLLNSMAHLGMMFTK